MAKVLSSCLFFIFILNLVFGFQAHAVPYDYTFMEECLSKPQSPQYNGGIVVNPELNEGLKGWTTFGDAKLEHAESYDGNKYIVASSRNQSFDSFSQTFNLEKEKLYTFSAWLQVKDGSNVEIAGIFKTKTGYVTAGWVHAQKGCWSMLKGGLVVNVSAPADLYFESNNIAVDIWVDSISLQPFTQEEWKSHQDESIAKVRKRRVKFRAVDEEGEGIANATISVTQRRSNFPLGCAINKNILHNTAYHNWYSNEVSRGNVNYTISDAMVNFAKSRGIAIRGHNILWDNPGCQPSWVPALSTNDLWEAAKNRVDSVVERYKGQLFHWDVVNENLHWFFFESRLGQNVSSIFYQKASYADPKTVPFLNDYNTIEENTNGVSSPQKYLEKIRVMRKDGYDGQLGIGVQGHFSHPNLPYTRSAIDVLASAKLPIWVTELDLKPGPNQATYLDQILRELHSHWAIEGIIIWSAWRPQGCYRMCLTDVNFTNLATGDAVDKFIHEYLNSSHAAGVTDSNGFFETSLFHGEYEAILTHPKGHQFSAPTIFNLKPNHKHKQPQVFHFKININQ